MDNPLVRSALLREDGGLSVLLKRARDQAGLSSRGLARAAGWTFAKPSKIERGLQMPEPGDIETWAEVCGVDPAPLLKAFNDLAVFSADFRADPFETQDAYNVLYAAAERITLVETSTVPGPLQTRPYAERVLSRITGRPTSEVEDAIAKRLERARFLDDESKTFTFIMNESVLHWWHIPVEVLRDQIHAIQSVATRSNVEVRFVPMNRPIDISPYQSFALYDDLAVVELHSGLYSYPPGSQAAEVYREWRADWVASSVAGSDALGLLDAALARLV